MFGSLLELKNANFSIFLQPKIGNQGQYSCQKQSFMEIALLNVKTYIQKLD